MLKPRSGVHVPPTLDIVNTGYRQHWISLTLDIVNYDVRLRDNYDGQRTFQLSRTTIS
jgi:hypothetical protein